MNKEQLLILNELSSQVKHGNISSMLIAYCRKDGKVIRRTAGDWLNEIDLTNKIAIEFGKEGEG